MGSSGQRRSPLHTGGQGDLMSRQQLARLRRGGYMAGEGVSKRMERPNARSLEHRSQLGMERERGRGGEKMRF